MNTESSQQQEKTWQGLSISNLLTYGSLISGLLGYFFYSKTGNLKFVGLFLCFSFIFDIFDGQFARLFKNRSVFVTKLGSYLDSLTDFAVFGVLPGLAVLQIPSTNLYVHIFTFCTVIFFVICSMTRLGSFHILTSNANYFIGLPTTLSGLCLTICFLLTSSKMILAGVLLVLSFMMISSFQITRPGKKGLMLLAGVAVFIGLIHAQKVL